jgi:hypothetical protein
MRQNYYAVCTFHNLSDIVLKEQLAIEVQDINV